ncbi:MAG: hypothetical protein M1570_18130 [Chloroflexi bacterium]|nr:hypothetical protein [Chloroflexota bacterium]
MHSLIELFRRHIWLGPLIALVVGLGLGLIIGWESVGFKASATDVAAAADSYSLNADLSLAQERLASLSPVEKQLIFTELVNAANANHRDLEAQRLTALADALRVTVGPGPAIAAPAGATPAPQTTPTATGLAGNLSGLILPLILVFVVVVLISGAAFIFFLRIAPGMHSKRAPETASATSAPAESQWMERTAPTPTAAAPVGGLGHFVPQYTLGNDNYDTSYSLETPRGEFLGECGMGISETIGEGKPDKVTAFDLWLFDKADVRTVTQILMSDYAFNDQTLRTKLATKGEAVHAEKGRTVKLATQSLAITAQIVELVYASNPSYPPNSHFEKLIVEIVPTIKDGAGR